jgi:hypothetical protein
VSNTAVPPPGEYGFTAAAPPPMATNASGFSSLNAPQAFALYEHQQQQQLQHPSSLASAPVPATLTPEQLQQQRIHQQQLFHLQKQKEQMN